MSDIGSGNDPSPSVAQYPALTQMGLVPPPGVDIIYENLLAEVLANRTAKSDHTGTGTRSLFAHQPRYDLHRGFPRVTMKFVAMKAVRDELLWFLHGETNVRWLQERDIAIWGEQTDDSGELGPVYGPQWRSQSTRDGGAVGQIIGLTGTLRTDPDSRRMLVSAWNVSELRSIALAPCHVFFQCYVADGRLNLQIYQCSTDLFLEVPFSIASYVPPARTLVQQASLEPGELIWAGGDCHIYDSRVGQARTQFFRVPNARPFPTLRLERAESINSYGMDDIDASQSYEHHPTIKAPVTV